MTSRHGRSPKYCTRESLMIAVASSKGGAVDGTAVDVNAGRASPDVEGDAGDVKPRAPGCAQEWHHLVGERTVLDPQVDLGLATVGALEAEQQLAVGVAALDLGHLLGGVLLREGQPNITIQLHGQQMRMIQYMVYRKYSLLISHICTKYYRLLLWLATML